MLRNDYYVQLVVEYCDGSIGVIYWHQDRTVDMTPEAADQGARQWAEKNNFIVLGSHVDATGLATI